MPEPGYQLVIVVRKYAGILVMLAMVLVTVHSLLYLYNYQVEELPWLLLQLFDLDEEYNIPTWFSSFLLLNNAFVLYLIACAREVRKRSYWMLLAGGFFLMSVDEIAGIHETINSSIEINWAIPGAIFVFFIAAGFVPFLLSLPRRQALLYVASGVVYISGALLVEFISEDLDAESLRYAMMVAIEEGLEMMGALLFLIVNLNMMKLRDEVRVDVTARQPKVGSE